MAVGLVEKTAPGLPISNRGQSIGQAGRTSFVKKVIEVTFDSSYPTGGETIDLAAVEMIGVSTAIIPPSAGYTFSPAVDAFGGLKILVWQGDNPNVAAAPSLEVPNTTNLSTLSVRVLLLGIATT